MIKKLAASLALILPISAWSSVYIPAQDTQLNAHVDRLLVLVDAPVLSKPYNIALVEHYLEKGRYRHPHTYAAINDRLERYRGTAGVSNARVSAAYSDVSDETVDRLENNRYGELLSSSYNGYVSGYYNATDWMSVSVGASYIDNHANEMQSETILQDTYVSFFGLNTQLDIGYRDSWMSPSTDSSLLMSTNSAPALGITVSNILPYESLWNLRYELGVRQLSEYQNIIYGDRVETGQPALINTHISIEPLDGWTLAFNRTMQFGGGSRDVDLKSILKAFFNPVLSDNAESGGLEDCPSEFVNTCEFGNQIASISTRMNFKGSTPFSVYGEYAGEDTAQNKNTRLGNIAITGGIYFPKLTLFGKRNRSTLMIEASTWQNGWYTHHIYRDGYVNLGSEMGHWFANYRNKNRSVSGHSATLKTQYFADQNTIYDATFRYLSNDNEWSAYQYSTAYELDLGVSFPWNELNLESRLYLGTDVFDQSFVKVQLGIAL